MASRTPRTAPEAAARHLNLGNVIRARYVRSQHRPDLDRAIAEYERSIALPAFTVDDRYTMLVDLASALQDRYDAGDDVDDLARARDCCARVLQLAERGGAQWRHAQNQLGRILVADAALTGSAATVRAAEAAFQEVLEHTTAEDPEHLQALLNLASTHARQYRVTGDDRARAAAVASFAAIMHTAAAVDPAVGAAAGRSWGGLATTDGDWAQAAAAYTAGLACLTQLHRRQSGRDHKESWLREGQGTTVDAAYALARAGDPAGAVAVLESGRAQLLSEALERVPADLRTLAATGHAELPRASGARQQPPS